MKYFQQIDQLSTMQLVLPIGYLDE
jgi:hypothetical protein